MKKFITPDVLANQVRMLRSAFKWAFMFVEGDSDERFYSLFTDSQTCKIIICHGRPHVFRVCQILEQNQFNGFLGIADADFNHLDSTPAPCISVLFTDWHDAECYLVRSPALERVLHEHSDAQKLEEWKEAHGVSDVRQHLLEQAAMVGFLLWHSLSENLGLNFEGVSVDKFVSKSAISVDVSSLISHVAQLSALSVIDAAAFASAIKTKQSRLPDHWQVVRGHDYVHFLCYALRVAWKRDQGGGVSSNNMEGILRMAYPLTMFAETRLCRQILAWEASQKGVFKILSALVQTGGQKGTQNL